ncbi:MBL fold metallo-hydrolase [Geobacter sp. DSM 9736]|uniref:MBL fold metallo-hydrolase n=1 Tax=Geobacter sp. DSM 9736 TaxID=1277350 RepID=UPI000B514987|nr:MBL fold metallo-hydrolase [Geobacter sp. DSM 9736]SNB45584.1 Phosphoribosyl 1,2-cyclic phosphodiesterase [Geobacter sp. DSM 9736]
MRVCLLASGSKGNAIFVETGDTRLLVDAGLSAREITSRLAQIGVCGEDLDAILISHEHSDHTRGAGTLARKYKVPLFISYPTCRESERVLGGKAPRVEFESGYTFGLKDIQVDPFPITHDACDPVGFLIESSEGRIGIATDLGCVTALVREKLKNSRMLVIESNHDEEMLIKGPYPWHLKQRIKSRHGHLSNIDSVTLLDDLIHPGLEAVFLAHLSEVNNDPAVALGVAEAFLSGQSICSPRLVVGNQYRVSQVVTA